MRRPLALLFLLLLLPFLAPAPADACDGARRPACGRTAWLAKWVEKTVVHPGDGIAIDVKIGVLPFVSWNLHPNCAQPSAASLTLTLECEPDDGGAPVIIGPMMVPVAVPTAVGVQSVLTGAGMTPELGGAYCFQIPMGTLPAGKNYVCGVTGEYTVTFTGGLNGAGSGTIVGVGDTEVCIVEPSPDDTTVPRLDMRRLNPAQDDGFISCRKGDQGYAYYLLVNNDDQDAVDLYFETWTNQVARRPTGGTVDDTYAISTEKPGRDNFPLSFINDLALGDLMSVDGIMDKTDQRIGSNLHLEPNELRIIGVAIRTHGMCANGSCSEGIAKVDGWWSDGSPALACAGTAFLVDDVAAKSPLCEYTVGLSAAPNTDVRWTRPEFDHDHMLRTHFDNIKPFQKNTIATSGSNLNSPWPDQLEDFIRMEQAAHHLKCTMDGYRQSTGFARDRNKITITDLPESDFSFSIPHVAKGRGGSDLKLNYDALANLIKVLDAKKNKKLFDGTLADLIGNPPTNLTVDPATSLTVAKTGPGSAPVLFAAPEYRAALFESTSDPDDEDIGVFDARTAAPLSWNAASSTAAAQLIAASGAAGSPVTIDWNLTNVPTPVDVECGYVTITNGSALNSPLHLPIAVRKDAFAAAEELGISHLFAKLHPTSTKAKDSLHLHGTLPLTEGMSLKNMRIGFEIGPRLYDFVLDKKGKSLKKKSTKHSTLRLFPEKIGGVIQDGDATFELTIKKARLASMLKCYGVFPGSIPPEGLPFELLLRAIRHDLGTVRLLAYPVVVTGDSVKMEIQPEEK